MSSYILLHRHNSYKVSQYKFSLAAIAQSYVDQYSARLRVKTFEAQN